MTTLQAYMEYERRRRQALLDADVDALTELLHPHCVYVHASGKVESGATYVQRMTTDGSPYLALVSEDEQLTVFDETGVVTYRQNARMQIAGEAHDSQSVCTAVWQRSGGDPENPACRLILFQNAHVAA